MFLIKNYKGPNHFLVISLLIFQYNRDSIHKNGKKIEKPFFYHEYFSKIIQYSESVLNFE
jgi:hypothetical protein